VGAGLPGVPLKFLKETYYAPLKLFDKKFCIIWTCWFAAYYQLL